MRNLPSRVLRPVIRMYSLCIKHTGPFLYADLPNVHLRHSCTRWLACTYSVHLNSLLSLTIIVPFQFQVPHPLCMMFSQCHHTQLPFVGSPHPGNTAMDALQVTLCLLGAVTVMCGREIQLPPGQEQRKDLCGQIYIRMVTSLS